MSDSNKENKSEQGDKRSVWEKIKCCSEKSIPWLTILLAVVIPISTTAMSVVGTLILVLALFAGNYRQRLQMMVINPVSLALLLYMALFFIGLLWTENIGEGLDMIRRQWRLLLLPVLLPFITEKLRTQVVYGFIIGVSAAMLVTWLAFFDVIDWWGLGPENLTLGNYHVIYNPLLAFGFYLVCHELFWRSRTLWVRAGWLILAVAMALNMFVTKGRAGQLAFFVIMAVLMVQLCRKKLLRACLIFVVLFPLVFIAAYKVSPVFKERIDQVKLEIEMFHENPATSIGQRLLFWQNSWDIIKDNLLFGVGTGDFPDAYAEINKMNSPMVVATDNPHSQYVFSLCEFGLLGLLSLLFLFATQIREAFRNKDEWWRIKVVLPLFFLVIMLVESYLLVYETGFLFSLFAAVLFVYHTNGNRVKSDQQ